MMTMMMMPIASPSPFIPSLKHISLWNLSFNYNCRISIVHFSQREKLNKSIFQCSMINYINKKKLR